MFQASTNSALSIRRNRKEILRAQLNGLRANAEVPCPQAQKKRADEMLPPERPNNMASLGAGTSGGPGHPGTCVGTMKSSLPHMSQMPYTEHSGEGGAGS